MVSREFPQSFFPVGSFCTESSICEDLWHASNAIGSVFVIFRNDEKHQHILFDDDDTSWQHIFFEWNQMLCSKIL